MNGSSPALPSSRPHGHGASTSLISSTTTAVNGTSVAAPQSYPPRDVKQVDHLEDLQYQLSYQQAIMEGAEKILVQSLNDIDENLLDEVKEEFDLAQAKMETIVSEIRRLQVDAVPRVNLGGRKKSNSGASSIRSRVLPSPEENDRGEDIRSVLQNASYCVKTLLALGGPGPSPVVGPNSASSSTYPTDTDVDRTRAEYMTRLTHAMQRNVRVRYELNAYELLQCVIPGLADRSSKDCRAAAYRLIRHTLVDTESVERLRDQNIDWYIIKSLARDNKHATEKEQVIKLIRAIVEIGSEKRGDHAAPGLGTVPLSEAVMRALVAVAEHPEDPFKSICILTLTEILLIDIDLMARCGGIRTLLHHLAEGPLHTAPMLATAFLYLIDSPKTRMYLTPGQELEIALAVYTDAYGKGPEHLDRMRGSKRIITSIFQTWSGLLYFCMDDMAAVRSIIDLLRVPLLSMETRDAVLDLFFDLFNIKTPKWYQTFIDGRRLTMYRRSGQAFDKPESTPSRSRDSLKLRDQFIGLLVLVFTKAGLLDAITAILEETTEGTALSRRAVLLMGEVMHLANRLLPLTIAAEIQSAARLFDLASDLSLGEHRIVGTSALSALDSFNRHRTRTMSQSGKTVRMRANSIEDPVRRGQRQVEQVKLKIGMQMDDRTFSNLLLETNVMMAKDHTKWNYDALLDVIEGPLLNPKRMEEVIKVSRFMKRVMSFFHPLNRRFAELPRKGNARWVKLGIALLNTLLASAEGRRFLREEDPLVQQIVGSLVHLDPHHPNPPTQPLFSKKYVEDTLSYSYVEMLGTLSRQPEGVEILEAHKVFTCFYHIMDLQSREDLMTLVVENLDYNVDGHPRVVLAKALTSTSLTVRFFATNHLGDIIRRSASPPAWTLRLLLTQIYDPSLEVCQAGVRFLDEVCEDPDVLHLVVEMQPTFEHLGEMAHPLLMKAMSTPLGFRYLHDGGYIEREMDSWFHERNEAYAVQMEIFLGRAFNFGNTGHDDDAISFDGTVPPHFYGEMTKTDLGCALLQEKGHFGDFASFIRQHGQEDQDAELLLKLKSTLWAVGNAGAAEGGLPFLEEEDLIPVIVDIAQTSPVCSVRGTCFFVLGLLCSTPQGAEVLADFGWEATLSPLGVPAGISVPANLEKFTLIEPWSPVTFDKTDRLSPPTDEAELEVMTAIYNLSNMVIANNASRSLTRMKSRPEYRQVFASSAMLFRALHIISTSKYRQPVRRYILDLFDLELNGDTVAALAAWGKRLRSPDTPGVGQAQKSSRLENPRAFSIYRPRRAKDMDDESDSSDEEGMAASAPPTRKRAPVVTLRPMSRIIGFKD